MRRHNLLKRLAVRATYYPSLGFNGLMCALRVWRKWDWIDEHVLLGCVPSRRDIDRLHALGVTGIVNLCEEFAGHLGALRRLGLEQLHLPTLDYHPPTTQDLLRGVAFIERHRRRGGKAYVHCKAGRARGPTLAIGYAISAYDLDPEQAWARVRAARPQIDGALHRRPVLNEFRRMLCPPAQCAVRSACGSSPK
jgi:atypical dual specificity phosphatase